MSSQGDMKIIEVSPGTYDEISKLVGDDAREMLAALSNGRTCVILTLDDLAITVKSRGQP